MISGDSGDIQIMGGADGVEIMGADADPASAPPPAGAPMPMIAMQHVPKHISTGEKVGVAAVLLLLVGGVAYAMHKK